MDEIHIKPKLVFFQYRYGENLQEFLLMHKRDHVKCLSEFFDVTVIHEDCDYQQVCDTYQPDLTLFESGISLRTCQRPKITNIRACPKVPKLGLHNADAWSENRAGILSDMQHLGIETFFSICTTAAEHTPEIAQNLFIWPNFIDPQLYQDYGESKVIPVLFTGCTDAQYPWRHKIYKVVTAYYPSLLCPHRGYGARAAAGRMMYGKQYARTINASWFVPACGTLAKEIVRKHFEVPGCNACVIAEKSPGLEAAGFVDMENCVFANEHDVLDKIDYLFQNPHELERITKNGYQLVHTRHTLKHRDQIFQWFNLQKNLKSNEKIVQTNPFEPLIVVEKSSRLRNSYIICIGMHLVLVRQAYEMLWAGEYEKAEVLYLKCLNYMRMLPEAKLGLALCNLYKGNPGMALSWIVPPIQYILQGYKAVDPDPVEWACFIMSLLCQGKVNEASKRASQFPWLGHSELDRTRWVVSVLKSKGGMAPWLQNDEGKQRRSIHRLPSRSFKEWIAECCIMLKACRQCDLAETLEKVSCAVGLPVQHKQGSCSANRENVIKEKEDIYGGERKTSAFGCGKKATLRRFDNPLIYDRLRLRVRNFVLEFLHRLEAKVGYFLPYKLSEKRNDEFFHAIEKMAREEDIRTALVIGAASGEGSTEALLTGIMENQSKPSVFCVNGATGRFESLRRRFAGDSFVKFYGVPSACAEQFRKELEKTVGGIKKANEINVFDAVLIDTSELSHELTLNAELNNELYGVSLVLLDDINAFYNYEHCDRLLRDSKYVLVAQNPGLRNGYAIFKRESKESLATNLEAVEGSVKEQDSEVRNASESTISMLF